MLSGFAQVQRRGPRRPRTHGSQAGVEDAFHDAEIFELLPGIQWVPPEELFVQHISDRGSVARDFPKTETRAFRVFVI